MQNLERYVIKAISSITFFFASNIFLFFLDKQIPVNFITIVFTILFGWPAVLIMVIAVFLS
ncbi:TPA: hypothetical protein GXZ54_05740 [bacterium]|nr:hypothetical protein [bacterium]